MKHSLKRGLAIMLALAVVCSLAIMPVAAEFVPTATFTATGFTLTGTGFDDAMKWSTEPGSAFAADASSQDIANTINEGNDLPDGGVVELTPADYTPSEDGEAYFYLCVYDNANRPNSMKAIPFFYDTTANKFVAAEPHALSLSVAAFPTGLTYTGNAQNVEVAITVKSTGLQDEANVTLALDGADAASFALTKTDIGSLAAGGTDATAKLKLTATNAKDSYAVTVKVTSGDVTTAVTANVTAKIGKATPTVTITAPTTEDRNVVAGTHLNDITLSGTVTGVGGATLAGGTLEWDNKATNPELTTGNQGWTYTPADATNYNNATGNIPFTVAGAITPTIELPENADTGITYDGQGHGVVSWDVTQDGASKKGDYKLVYKKGATELAANAVPTDAGDYTVEIQSTADGTAIKTESIKIIKANATLTWPDPLNYTEGSEAGVTVTSNFGTPAVTYEIVTVEHEDADGTCTCPGGAASHDATNTDCTYKPEVAEVKVTGALNDAGVKDALKGLKAGDTFVVKASVAGTDNWNEAAEETKTFTVVAAPSSGGGFVSNDFTVTYAAGAHGTINGATSEKVKRNESPAKVPTVTANKGYAFIGWTADGKTLVNPAAQTITKNTTFTAVYGDHLNYMVGRSAMEFVPDGNLTRAEAAAILSRLTEGFEEDGTYPAAPYSDLAAGAWYVKYINFAADKGIVNGRTDGTFDPDASITRAEFATMIANFAKIAPVDTAAVSTDVADHWAEGYIAALEQAKIVTGYEDGTFKPNNSITRAEAATMVNGAIGRVPMTGLDLSVNGYDNPFVDVNESQWFYGQVMEATVDHVTAHFHK